MCATMLCVAAMAIGIDPGWQRLDDGGWRYLIQIDPHTFEELKAGRIDKIESDVPWQLRDIRSYRITIGRGEVPRDELPSTPPTTAANSASSRSEPGPSASARPEPPDRIPATTATSPGQRPTTFSEQILAKPELTAPPETADEPSKPWLPLILALACAVACFAGMVYLGWIAMDYRRRYLDLFHKMVDTQQMPTL